MRLKVAYRRVEGGCQCGENPSVLVLEQRTRWAPMWRNLLEGVDKAQPMIDIANRIAAAQSLG
jgi:hypothetical protein